MKYENINIINDIKNILYHKLAQISTKGNKITIYHIFFKYIYFNYKNLKLKINEILHYL